MKKNLAKRIVLGLLTGAVLMSSSVAWAETNYSVYTFDTHQNSFGVGYSNKDDLDDSINPGTITQGSSNSIVIGINSKIAGAQSIALGNDANVSGSNSVALGYGSVATGSDVVSVGHGGVQGGVGSDYRKIVNVENGSINVDSHEAVTGGQLYDAYGIGKEFINNNGSDLIKGKNLTEAVVALGEKVKNISAPDLTAYAKTADVETALEGKADKATTLSGYGITDAYTKTEVDAKFVKIGENNVINNSITINENSSENPVTIGSEGITVGTNSTHMDSTGFYAGRKNTNLDHTYDNVKAAMTEDGKLKAADGKFEVDTEGKVTASSYIIKDSNGNETNIKTALDSKANAADVYTKDQADGLLDAKANKADVYDKTEIDTLLSNNNADAIAGINQRLEKTNVKINKVGAGAAALAALHPLDYDPDDKLTFSAGMGNYAGENAAALGAFYRPNEKFMLSLGGTMGNGENMVNLGLSIGLDKPNSFAKMSKRELIQEVNAVKAENEAMKAEMAEMKAMLQELLAKK